MLRSVLFSVVALAAAGTALAHDGDRWDGGRHERQEWRHEGGRGEWRHERYDRDYRYRRPVVRYVAPAYYGPAYYGPGYVPVPSYYGYAQPAAYGAVVAPGLGLSLVIPVR